MGRVNSHAVAKGDLPSGFRELNYIACTGTQYIDTGFKPNQDTRIIFDGILNYYGSYSLMGVSRGIETVYLGKGSSSNDRLYFGYGNDYGTINNNGVIWGRRRVYDINKNVMTVDNGEYTIRATTATFQCTDNFILFAYINNGNVTYYQYNTYCFSAKFYDDNGTLIRDYVPAYDTVNDRPCLYDKVNDTAYYNQGTGEFLYG